SSCGNRFVTLQRPPPEIINLLPNLLPFSTKRVFAPNSAAEIAAINPAVPPPMTTTLYVISVFLSMNLHHYIIIYFGYSEQTVEHRHFYNAVHFSHENPNTL